MPHTWKPSSGWFSFKSGCLPCCCCSCCCFTKFSLKGWDSWPGPPVELICPGPRDSGKSWGMGSSSESLAESPWPSHLPLPPNLLLFFHNASFLVTQSSPALCDPMDCSLPGSSVHRIFPDKNTGVGCRALLQGIFQT